MSWLRLMLMFGLLALPAGCAQGSAPENPGMEAGKQAGGGFGVCVVSGRKATGEFSSVYNGRTYYFCSASCVEAFKANPQAYADRIKEFKLEAYRFGYSPDRLEVKKNDVVRILATSRDVPHGVFIKEYGINAVVKKGETTVIEFLADKPGEFDVICSIYCGPGHREMKAKLVVGE